MLGLDIFYKASKKGVIWKSYEAELQLSDFGLRSNSGEKWSNMFECSSLDIGIGSKMEKMVGKRVKVKYTQWFIKPISQSSDYTIVEISEENEKSDNPVSPGNPEKK